MLLHIVELCRSKQNILGLLLCGAFARIPAFRPPFRFRISFGQPALARKKDRDFSFFIHSRPPRGNFANSDRFVVAEMHKRAVVAKPPNAPRRKMLFSCQQRRALSSVSPRFEERSATNSKASQPRRCGMSLQGSFNVLAIGLSFGFVILVVLGTF
jgi:hypothetical protein